MTLGPALARQRPSVHLRRIGGLAAMLVLVAGCSTGVDRPPDCDAASVTRSATLGADGKLDPQTVNVCRDQKVTITVAVKADGVLHVHGYDDQGVAASVHAGRDATLSFTATHAGQFVIELHAAGGSSGEGSGVLTVHER